MKVLVRMPKLVFRRAVEAREASLILECVACVVEL